MNQWPKAIEIRNEKNPILYMVDKFTTMTVGTIIKNKKAETVAEAIILNWLKAGYGSPECLHSDNGKEFCGQEMKRLAEILNIPIKTTAGYSPFQNGLCEVRHKVVDNILQSKILAYFTCSIIHLGHS